MLIILCPLMSVDAENISVNVGTTITGDQFASTGCQAGSLYCYSGAGIRISLYYYDNGVSKKIGSSHDVWSRNQTYPGKDKSWTSKSYHYSSLGNSNDGIKSRVNNGTTWYTNSTTWASSCNSCKKISTSNKYKIFELSYNEYIKSGNFETTTGFSDYTNSDNTKFRQWIDNYLKSKMKKSTDVNKYFDTTIDNGKIKKYYITVEPIFRLWVNTNGPSNDNKKSSGYIGTVYELSKIYHYDRYSKALRSISESEGSFVGDILKATPNTIPAEENNKGWGWRVLNKYSYGVGVYKLEDYADPACACDEDDYKCAMDYCDSAVGEGNRKTCVTTTCGVKDPGFSTCGKDTSTSGKTTSCAAETSASNTTCTSGNTSTYYKTICKEQSDVYYNDSLPTSLQPGTGFSYSLLLSGSKKCNTAFDVNKWNFDYAVSNNSNRQKLNQKLTNYQNLSSDTLSKYQYSASDANVTIDIEETLEKQTTSKTVTKKLQKFVDVTKKDIKVSNRDSTFQVMTKKTKYNNKTFISSMSSIYALQNVCIDGASGETYDAKYDDLTKKYICNNTNDGPYNKYFTNLKAQVDTINGTTVKITKSSSNMDELTNTCHYKVEDQPLSCVILKDNNTYSLKLYSENNLNYKQMNYSNLKYSLSTNQNSDNWSNSILSTSTGILTKITKKTSTEFTLYGKINIDGKTIATCSSSQPEKNTGNSCTTKYKPTQYEEIAEYCKNNWYTDKNNYTNEKACYNACTNTEDSCKIKYTCNDTTSIQQYCSSQYNKITQATLYRSCINDCSCGGGDAVYRPISLTTPFPNRQAGANWQGYEENINDGSEAEAEYVIELSASDIENINAQTEKYNTSTKNAYIDYVRASNSDANGEYVSKFIHETNENLFCIIDSQSKRKCK